MPTPLLEALLVCRTLCEKYSFLFAARPIVKDEWAGTICMKLRRDVYRKSKWLKSRRYITDVLIQVRHESSVIVDVAAARRYIVSAKEGIVNIFGERHIDLVELYTDELALHALLDEYLARLCVDTPSRSETDLWLAIARVT